MQRKGLDLNMESEFNIGDIVFSKMGRDSGRYYIVMSTEENFAYICDGDLHKTEKPKKKKIKHLKHTMNKSEYVKTKISDGLKVTNTELRRAVAEFQAEHIGGTPASD